MRKGLTFITLLAALGLVATGCLDLLVLDGPAVKSGSVITRPKSGEKVGQLMPVEGYVKDKDRSTYTLTIDSGEVVAPIPIEVKNFMDNANVAGVGTADTFSVLIDLDGLPNGEHDLNLEGLDDVAIPVTFVLDKTSRPGRPEITDITGGVKVSDVPPLVVAASGALTFIGKAVESTIDVQIYSGVGSSNPALVASGTSTNFSFSITVASLGSPVGEENEYTVATRAVNALGNFLDSQAVTINWDTKTPESTIALAADETDVINDTVNRGEKVSIEITVADKFAPIFDLAKGIGNVQVYAGSTLLGTATKSPDNPSVFTYEWDTGAMTSAGAFITATGVQSIVAVVTDLVGQTATSANTLSIDVENGPPQIVTAVFNDTIPGDGVGAGDTITVAFTEAIQVLSTTPSAAFALTDPTGVTTPSFGTNASMTGTGTTVTITLGTSPVLNAAGAEINATRIDIATSNTVITDLVGNNAEGLTTADDGTDALEITPSDSTRPKVTAVTVSDPNDKELGAGDLVKLVITFSEQMDTSVNPSIIFGGLTFTAGSWSSDGTLNNTYTVTSTTTSSSGGVQVITIAVARDLFGNIMLTDSTNTFNVDLIAPTIESATFADSGSVPGTPDGGDIITIVFNEAIMEVTPNLTNFDVYVGTPPAVVTNPFGSGFSMALGAAPNEMVITLGSNPLIVVTGIYTSSGGTASGIAIANTAANIGITDLAGNLPAVGSGTAAKDIT